MTSSDGQNPASVPVTALAGVGPARAERLARLDVHSVRDLLVLVPRGLERQGGEQSVASALAMVGTEVAVRGRIRSPRIFRRGPRRSTVSAEVEDATGRVRANFFHQPWMYQRLRELSQSGEEVRVYGRVVETKSGVAFASPRVVEDDRELPREGTILPLYPLTEGIGLEYLRGLVRAAAEVYAERIEERLPVDVRRAEQLPSLAEAVRDLHAPRDEAAFLAARRRLALERVLVSQVLLAEARAAAERASARAVRLSDEELLARVAALPFPPTDGQKRVMRELVRDLARRRPMRRLLQGDVSSGKTMVALFAISVACAAGGQAALLVPTEVLAEQHYLGLAPWLRATGLRAALLSGSMPLEDKRSVHFALENGDVDLVVGTHALLSDDVRFARLDLALIDEQQRFGVEQKRALIEKGRDVHMLLLTATPIPRTLALATYGDLDISTLREKPPGRGAISTRIVPPAKRASMLRFLDERMAAGEHVFWVCPRIEGGDGDADGEGAEGTQAAERAFLALERSALAKHGIELVHGRIPADERVVRIERFRSGDARLLVGTSIIEVGIDVPEATVIVIEGAERFGLAQLHQLRGRVGRGPAPAWCLLFAKPESHERLRILVETSDGFRIAEEDLRQRGMGDLAGMRQAGRNVEGLDDPEADVDLLRQARRLLAEHRDVGRRYLALARGSTAALV